METLDFEVKKNFGTKEAIYEDFNTMMATLINCNKNNLTKALHQTEVKRNLERFGFFKKVTEKLVLDIRLKKRAERSEALTSKDIEAQKPIKGTKKAKSGGAIK